MKPLWVGREAIITKGVLKDKKGMVVSFDSELDLASIQLDEITFVSLSSEYLIQEGEIIQLSFDL